jgi:ribosome maturation factor RimP
MIDEDFIKNIIEEKLQGTHLFVTGISVKSGNNIQIAIDGDTPVTIDDCVGLSRHIESQLDREKEDFNLNVASDGADSPIKNIRQYKKNIGRKLSIKLMEGETITAKLLEVDDQGLKVLPEITKGRKIIIQEEALIGFGQIEKANCILSFK